MAAFGVDLLITIVDASGDGWAEHDEAALAAAKSAEAGADGATAAIDMSTRGISFPEFVAALNLFHGAYCAMGRHRRLAVLGFNGVDGGYVWPQPPVDHAEQQKDNLRAAVVRKAVTEKLLELRCDADSAAPPSKRHDTGDESAATKARFSNLSSCLSLALCYQNAVKQHCLGALNARILILMARPDVPAEYIGVINSTFSAQRCSIPIDAVSLCGHPSIFLQQAAHLTGGIYSEPTKEQQAGLFQFLVAFHLPDAAVRSSMLLPAKHIVDLRAHCFCHKKHVETAHVCSVCLSIWCKHLKKCPTCGTTSSSDKLMIS